VTHSPDETVPPSDAGATVPSGDGAGPTVPSSGSAPARVQATPRDEPLPERLGDCRVEGRLGSGGFGDVLLAVQESDLKKRRVAIKLLKKGMDSAEVLERFRLEQKVLDTLNHPNIARLYGAGVADNGCSYFIMEYVPGMPLDKWCKAENLDVVARVKLLQQVAAALAHAHDKGIIHRDLKPANVMVGPDGVPKLLDFGIARFTDRETRDEHRAFLTQANTGGPLTPAYASPEQFRGEELGVATDIYSMGALMYEVLTGRPPFDFRGCTLDQIKKRVIEEPPTAPSRAPVVTDGGKTTTSRVKDARLLRGDLDNIVLMALRKETTGRYRSAQALIEDLDAYLQGRPVKARPSSMAYRLRKWVGRHRMAVLLGVCTALLAVSLWGGWFTVSRLEERTQRQKMEEKRSAVDEKGTRGIELARDAAGSTKALQDLEKQARGMLKRSPSDLEALRQLRDALRQQAAVCERTRDTAAGLPVAAESVKLAREIHDRTRSEDDERRLATALQQYGDLFVAANRFDEAREPFMEQLRMREAVALAKPNDLTAKRLLGKALVRMHEVEVQCADYRAAKARAVELCKVRAEIFQKLGAPLDEKSAKEKAAAERDLMFGKLFLAMDCMDLNELDQAELALDEFVAMARGRLAAVAPGGPSESVRWERSLDLAYGLDTLSKCRFNQDRPRDAVELSVQALEAARAAVAGGDAESQALRTYVYTGLEQARYLNELGRHQDAFKQVEDVKLFAEDRRGSAESRMKGAAMQQDQLLRGWAEQLRACRKLGLAEQAGRILAQVEPVAATPGDGVEWFEALTRVQREVALLKANPQDGLLPAKRSLESARKIKSPLEEACSLATLAEIQRRAGDVAQAQTLLDQACKVAAAQGTPIGQRVAREFAQHPDQPWSGRPWPPATAPAATAPPPGPSPPPSPPAAAPAPAAGVGTTGAKPS
jgi:tRNA A-37 threonylcarbamoyl transferase component Bud32/tetratricopeptide (TPR) repeat protein